MDLWKDAILELNVLLKMQMVIKILKDSEKEFYFQLIKIHQLKVIINQKIKINN